MPATAGFVNQRGPQRPRPGGRDILGAPQVVALVMAPDGRAGLVGVVEDVASGDQILARKRVVDAPREVFLPGNSAGRSGHVIEHSVACIGQGLELEESERLRA